MKPQPDYVRIPPGADRTVFVRANDLVSHRFCPLGGERCTVVTVTCGQAAEDMRKLQAAAEGARRVLTAAGIFRIADPLLGGVPRADVRLSHYLQRLKDAGVLPLEYRFINSDIDPADTATYRDPAVTALLEDLPTLSGDVDARIEALRVVDLTQARSTPGEQPQTMAELLTDTERAALGGSPPVDFMPRLRTGLRAVFPDAVRDALANVQARLDPPTGSRTGLKYARRTFISDYVVADDLPHALVDLRGSIAGFLDLLGLARPKMDHVADVEVTESGRVLAVVPAYGAVVRFFELCTEFSIFDDAAVRFAGGDGAKDVTFEPAYGSIAAVNGSSAELGVPFYGYHVLDDSQDSYAGAQHPLYQSTNADGSYSWWRIPSVERLVGPDRYYRRIEVEGSPGVYRALLPTSLRLQRNAFGNGWIVYDWTGFDPSTGLPVATEIDTHSLSEVTEATPALATGRFGHNRGELWFGGVIDVAARSEDGEDAELGRKASIEYCLEEKIRATCPRWGRLTVLVEPDGWDDARAVAVDDEFRLLLNWASGQIVLLQARPDGAQQEQGDVELGGTRYRVLERLCCLGDRRADWSVPFELPVMRNDRVRFLRDGDPLDKHGNQVPLSSLADDDVVGCDVTHYCGYVRPKHLGSTRLVGNPGSRGFTTGVTSPSYRSVVLRLSPAAASATSEVHTFEYCLAHREGRCGAAPAQCTRVTYLEPRAPNAGVPQILGAASLSDVPVSFFEVAEGCEETVATVTVTIEAYGDRNPPGVPAAVWSHSPPTDTGPPPEEKRCYVPELTETGYVDKRYDPTVLDDPDFENFGHFDWGFPESKWDLHPGSEDGREPPSWCFLPPFELVERSGWCVPSRHNALWANSMVRPAPETRWWTDEDGMPQREQGGLAVGDASQPEQLHLVGRPLSEFARSEMCKGSRARIVGVWGTHVGADNWRFAPGEDAGRSCTGYPAPVETSCIYDSAESVGYLGQVSNSWRGQRPSTYHYTWQYLGSAWHERLAGVEPCVGEAECDEWVPPLPGWYQVRIEVNAPPEHRWSRCWPKVRYDEGKCEQEWPGGSRPAPPCPSSADFTSQWRRLERTISHAMYCYRVGEDPDGPDGPEERGPPSPLLSREMVFVFDELIWVESPFLAF